MKHRVTSLLLIAILIVPKLGFTQESDELPFGLGEEFVFDIQSSRLGNVGRGRLGICGPDTVRGRETHVLYFDLRTRVTVFKVEDQTRSWVELDSMSSLRYYKQEKNPLKTHVEKVDMWLEEGRWKSEDGETGVLASSSPLDELSFIYLLRTLPFDEGRTWSLDRHFDTRRNPVVIQFIGRENIETVLGEMSTLVVEMRVRDAERFHGEGAIRFYLTDDAWRLPVRITTSAPLAGQLTMDMVQYTPPENISEGERVLQRVPCPTL